MTDPQPPVPVPEIETLIAKWRALADLNEKPKGWSIVANAQRICADELEAIRPSLVQERTRLHGALQAETQRRQEAEAVEADVRTKLWINHGCGISALYGDDGELQCSNGHPFHRSLDFKREPLTDIVLAATAALHRRQEAERTARQQAIRDARVWQSHHAGAAFLLDSVRDALGYQRAGNTDFDPSKPCPTDDALPALVKAERTAREQAERERDESQKMCVRMERARDIAVGERKGLVYRLTETERLLTAAEQARAKAEQFSDDFEKIATALDRDLSERSRQLAAAESSREALRTALESAGQAIHSEYCTQKHHPFCLAVEAALLAAQARETKS